MMSHKVSLQFFLEIQTLEYVKINVKPGWNADFWVPSLEGPSNLHLQLSKMILKQVENELPLIESVFHCTSF